MRDLIIRDGAFWTVRILGCDDVHVEGIHIINDMLMPNNDGIDVDRSRNVRINDCDIRSRRRLHFAQSVARWLGCRKPV